METMPQVIQILQTSGGWGLSAILMAVIWRLWKQIEAKDERIFALLDKQNKILEAVEGMRK